MTDDAAGTRGASLYERYKDALRRGHVAALRGRLDGAIEAYREASTIASDRALPHASIGGILVRMGRPEEAMAAYDRALELAPRDEAALRGLADVLANAGRRSDAADVLDRLAEALEAAGRLPDACDAARRALEMTESTARRNHVEELAGMLRAADGDEAARRALDHALRYLEPAAAGPAVAIAAVPPMEPEPAAGAEPERVTELASDSEPEPRPEAAAAGPEPTADGLALGRAAEDALYRGDREAARTGLLAAAVAHRAAGRPVAAIDACYLALAVAPADVDLHVMLAELYLERGWRTVASDKLLLLGRLAELADDRQTRDRLCAIAAARLPDEPRLADFCA